MSEGMETYVEYDEEEKALDQALGALGTATAYAKSIRRMEKYGLSLAFHEEDDELWWICTDPAAAGRPAGRA